MQLALTPEEAAFRDELRTFYTTEIPADIRERSRAGTEITKEDIVTTHRILNDHGLAVPSWPVEWGGKDWTPTQHQIWLDEMQLACVPEPLNFNAKMVGPVIAEFGSQAVKERFLPPTAALDIWWCQGFSEPEAGSDLASLRTTALRDGDSYVVNGQKTWTTLGQYADWIFCLVRTDPNAPKKQASIFGAPENSTSMSPDWVVAVKFSDTDIAARVSISPFCAVMSTARAAPPRTTAPSRVRATNESISVSSITTPVSCWVVTVVRRA